MQFHVIIPARLSSSRLPNKVLMDIAGKPMIQHVYEKALESGAETVVIATDDNDVKAVAEGFNASVCMTSKDHQSGSERSAEAIMALGFEDDEIVVNLQGDEPLMPPEVIHQVAHDLEAHDNVKLATICEPISTAEELFDSNVVKVVMNRRGYAMYFSRAPIAWNQANLENLHHYRHIGIYAYRAGFLQEYMQLEPCYLENMESLEQLRILWYGGRIHVAVAVQHVPKGVDTEEDLQYIKKLIDHSRWSSPPTGGVISNSRRMT